MLDLNTIDPATVPASPELDAMIAEQWMGWHLSDGTYCCGPPAHRYSYKLWLCGAQDWTGYNTTSTNGFHPSTNPAHASEARRKAERWELTGYTLGVQCDIDKSSGVACFTETNGDKGKAEALATCRAIVAVLKAASAAGGNDVSWTNW